MSAAIKVPLLLAFGYFLRFILITSTYQPSIASRVEVSTPVNSWKRVIEGIHLEKRKINPYNGDVFHEAPISLGFYKYLIVRTSETLRKHIFVAVDVTTAFALYIAARKALEYLLKFDVEVFKHPSSKSILLDGSCLDHIPVYVAACYALMPYSILSCAAMSTVVFDNLLIVIAFLTSLYGLWPITAMVLAMEAYRTVYTITLIVPCALIIYLRNENSAFIPVSAFIFGFCSALFQFIRISVEHTGGWYFMRSTYYFLASVPDLTPNIGLFWYFFTEVFDHFRVFFLGIFQLNTLIYTLPLALKLRRNPVLLFVVQLAVAAIFRPYPCLGDVALYMSFLPLFTSLFPYMKQNFFVGCAIAAVSLLWPLFWHMWIYGQSANANFYFALSLAFNTAQVFLVTELLYANGKRSFYLEHGHHDEIAKADIKLHLQ